MHNLTMVVDTDFNLFEILYKDIQQKNSLPGRLRIGRAIGRAKKSETVLPALN